MNQAVSRMLDRYSLKKTEDPGRAVREILQELALFGLWRAKFFEHAAFYGGAALRIIFGLDRFSEDLDFSLLKPIPRFDLSKYVKALKEELTAFGFDVQTGIKEKTKSSEILSAFLKADTWQQYLNVGIDRGIIDKIQKNQVIRIKIEVDTDPPPGFMTENRFLLQPVPFPVRTYSLPDLFAGKMHAAMCREWKNRVKGRDWYDVVWYVANHPELRLSHLEERMRQSGHLEQKEKLTEKLFLKLYRSKVEKLDVSAAIKEVSPFIQNRMAVESWSKELFFSLSEKFIFL